MSTQKDTFDRAIAWCRREYAKRSYNATSHCSFVAERIMEEAEKRFGLPTHGVEGWAIDTRRGVHYLNTGDSYGRTILFRSTGYYTRRWSLGAWGDIAEKESGQ